MENKYLRDIKDLNENFDEYKIEVENHISKMTKDKQLLYKSNQDYEGSLQKLKYTLRSTVSHNEINAKRLRDKLNKCENENCSLLEEVRKMRNKNQLLKTQYKKLEGMEKKLRNLISNKDSFS
jgi:chromosome segregation ATPase